MFLVFKQYYTHFYTLFHPQIFQKNTNNISQIPLSNGPLVVRIRKYIYLSLFGAILLCVCIFCFRSTLVRLRPRILKWTTLFLLEIKIISENENWFTRFFSSSASFFPKDWFSFCSKIVYMATRHSLLIVAGWRWARFQALFRHSDKSSPIKRLYMKSCGLVIWFWILLGCWLNVWVRLRFKGLHLKIFLDILCDM